MREMPRTQKKERTKIPEEFFFFLLKISQLFVGNLRINFNRSKCFEYYFDRT